MIGYVYARGGALTVNQDLGIKVATPIGTLFGQLLVLVMTHFDERVFFKYGTPALLSC